MKKIIFSILAVSLTLFACSQSKEDKYKLNWGFEQYKNGFPVGFHFFGNKDYLIYPDSTTSQSGKYSAVIEYQEGKKVEFRAIAFNLPHNYEGKSITLSGYIKTENVSEGYAGLWMRIDPDIAFDNMGNRGITGTTDWARYEVTLSMNPSKTKQIVIGGLLVGKGKMWLDDLHVTIDGKDIYDVPVFEREPYPAEKDKEFDKGSGISFPPLTEQLTADLELLGRVWGFVKYHHPEIGKGNYNWDYELFRIIPEYIKAKDTEQRDKILIDWIDKYGKIPPCNDCKPTHPDAPLKPDLSWIDNSGMTPDLILRIKDLYTNRHQGEHFYIGMYPKVGNPEFKNENSYSTMTYPDEGFRLLSLYRFWNMIQYFFPSRHLTDKDWNDVLKEYIPIFISAKNELEYELAALRIIGEIQDTHANLWGGGNKIAELRGNNFSPFKVQFIENKLVVTDYYNPEYAKISELQVGDIITHINGKTVEAIVDSLRIYYPASNEAAMLRDISQDILRSYKSSLKLNYESSGKKKQKDLVLYELKLLKMYRGYRVNKDEKCYKFLNDDIGYVTLANIADKDIPEIKDKFKNTKGIIIDIRNYPSTFVPFSLGSYFVADNTPFVKFTQGNANNPGEFVFRGPLQIPKTGETYQGKLIILINEFTQSQAEYTSMAFRAGKNTTIVGSTTAGADGNVSQIMLPGGLRTMISGIGVFYPDGTNTQRVGIVPDITVKPTINGIKQGKDELLEKAIETINKQP